VGRCLAKQCASLKGQYHEIFVLNSFYKSYPLHAPITMIVPFKFFRIEKIFANHCGTAGARH
jgi:hypothetical protein